MEESCSVSCSWGCNIVPCQECMSITALTSRAKLYHCSHVCCDMLSSCLCPMLLSGQQLIQHTCDNCDSRTLECFLCMSSSLLTPSASKQQAKFWLAINYKTHQNAVSAILRELQGNSTAIKVIVAEPGQHHLYLTW